MQIFEVHQTAERDRVVVSSPVESDSAPGADWKGAWTSAILDGKAVFIVGEGTSRVIRFEKMSDDGAVVLAGSATLPTEIDAVFSFVAGDQSYLATYRRANGMFEFRRIGHDFTLSQPVAFRRTHEPAVTAGFTMVEAFELANAVAIMGYDHEGGRVAIYTVEVTARGENGAPPIAVHTAWSHLWATGWTRFAFFDLGAEVFFLKTNDIWKNVNIDHINRGFADGTNEVDTHMALDDAYDLSHVAALTLDHGEPYFVAYRPDGHTTIYRIHADCRGWTAVAQFDAMPGARGLVAWAGNGKRGIALR
ncbi:hypothetical protein BH10PSE14_BH10PSE14_30710 [soil metagenome]